MAALLVLLALVCAGAAAAKDEKPARPERDATTILVRFEEPSQGEAKVRAEGDTALERTLTGVQVVRVRPGEQVDRKLERYRRRADVQYAEPNYLRRVDVTAPNDPLFGQQWGLAAIGAVAGWTGFPSLYASSGGVPIAIVDTGIDSSHADLAAKTLSPSGADCYPSTCAQWSAGSTDDHSHGTHVAGIAGAVANNAIGGAGVAFSSPLLPIKVCSAAGSCPDSAIVNGIAWARTHGARVINLSLGGYGGSTTLCSAVSQAISAGVVVVAAAGNDGTSTPSYPASCAGAIGVAATGQGDTSPSFSNHGYPGVFVSAPGVSILSTVPGGYASWNGTSMASPHVAGLAALLLGQSPARTPADVRRILAQTSAKPSLYGPFSGNPFGVCATCTYHPYYGYGRIDLVAALGGAAAATVTSFSPLSGTAGTSVTVTGAGLSGATGVTFGGVAAAFTVVSATKLTAIVPTAAVNGTIAVSTPAGTSASTAEFKVLPKITGFGGLAATAGSTLTVQGSGFAGATLVKLGTLSAPIVSVAPTEIVATVPAAAVTGKVTVTTPSGTATSASSFLVPPTISGLSAASAKSGDVVTVTGSTFMGVTSVKVGGVSASFTTVSGGSQLRLTVPAAATSGPVSVTNAGGTAVSSGSLAVLPRITSFYPLNGVAGAVVTVSGSGLELSSSVRFNGVAAALATGSTPTALRVVVPVGATNGQISVQTAGGTATGAAVFKVLPKITGFSPPSGVAGTSVAIQGSGFGGATAVKFGSLTAPILLVTPTEIVTAVPAAAVTGKVTVTTLSGSTLSATSFLVPPTVSGLSPATAKSGDLVTVTGAAFTSVSSVKVNGVAATFTVPGATQLRLTVPATATSGPVTVTAAGRTATSTATLSVLPKITWFSPFGGAPGRLVTLGGAGFTGSATVTFAGAAPVSATYVSPTQIKATVPAGAATGKLRVTTDGGTSAPSASSFTVKP